MMKYLVLVLIWLTFTGCEVEQKSENKTTISTPITNDTINEESLVYNNIELFKITQNPFPDAILELNTPVNLATFADNQDVKFNFNAVNFKFENGSHIALYIPGVGLKRINSSEYKTKFKKGFYTALAFLCDDQELSIKQPEAYSVLSFGIGAKYKVDDKSDLPLIALNVFSKKTEHNPIIDFYLTNTNISKNGNRVILSIDSTEFNLHNWSAYSVNGLKKGKHLVKLKLVDNKGKILNSPYSQDSTEIEVK